MHARSNPPATWLRESRPALYHLDSHTFHVFTPLLSNNAMLLLPCMVKMLWCLKLRNV